MRLLHNVFRVGRANLVLASDTPTTPVQADRDVTHTYLELSRFPSFQKKIRSSF